MKGDHIYTRFTFQLPAPVLARLNGESSTIVCIDSGDLHIIGDWEPLMKFATDLVAAVNSVRPELDEILAVVQTVDEAVADPQQPDMVDPLGPASDLADEMDEDDGINWTSGDEFARFVQAAVSNRECED